MKRQIGIGGTMLILFSIFSLSGCARQLQDLDRTFSKINSFATSNSSVPTNRSSMPRMSEAQVNTLHTLLMKQVHDQSIAQARAEANSDIEKILRVSACYSDSNPHTVLRQYSLPEKSFFEMPMWRTQYHPRSNCLTVTRLDSWKMLARNALTFRAVFVSEESSESTQVVYEMRRQPDGVWLLY